MSIDETVKDEVRLNQLGYTQDLKRALNLSTNFGIEFSILSEPMSVLPLIYMGIAGGGPKGILITWPIVSFFCCLVGASISEIASSFPTCGGLYYWSGTMAGRKWGPYASYMTGYFNFLGLVGICTGSAFSFGQFLSNSLIAKDIFLSESVAARLVTLFGGWCALFIGGFLASLNSHKIHNISNICFWINSIGFLAIIFGCFIASPLKISASTLIGIWNNDTGSPNSWLDISCILMAALTYTGFDAAVHLAEETHNPEVSGPKSIAAAMTGTFILGYLALFLILATIDPLTYSILEKENSYALMKIFINCTGVTVAIFLNILMMTIGVTNIFGLILTHARLAFAFSRDGALPYSKWLHSLNKEKIPLRATWIIVAVNCVTLLLSLCSETMHSVMEAFGVIGVFLAYLVPILLRLIMNKKFFPGPINLGKFSYPIAIISSLFLIFIAITLLLPITYTNPENFIEEDNSFDQSGFNLQFLQEFNWSPVIVGGVFIFANMFWSFSARKWFHGPPIDSRHTQCEDSEKTCDLQITE